MGSFSLKCLSKALAKQGIADKESIFLYRIHDVPDPDRFADLSMFARALGFKMEPKAKATAKQISALINQAEGTNHATLIKTAAIRSMAKAVYSVNNIGHFGLAFEHYTHFTSPIRRYADLIVHRLLNDQLEGKKISRDVLAYYAKLAAHMTDREISAADAERQSIKYKQVEFLQDKIGKIYDGTITGVTEWGMYVEDPDTKAEGMVSLRELTDDFYEYKEKEYALVGQKKKKRFALGDVVKVKLVKTDLERKTIDLQLV
jgi:ribonuclease R